MCTPWVTQGVVAGLAVVTRLVVGWPRSVGLAPGGGVGLVAVPEGAGGCRVASGGAGSRASVGSGVGDTGGLVWGRDSVGSSRHGVRRGGWHWEGGDKGWEGQLGW